MTALFIRHGTAVATSGGLCHGTMDCEGLTPDGRAEVIASAGDLAASGYRPAAIFTSPIPRARQTAELLAASLPAPIIEIGALRERGYGDWEGMVFETVRARLAKGETPPGGEGQADFHARVAEAITTILAGNGPCLIVSHGGVWQALHDHFAVTAPWLYPADVFEISIDGGELSARKLSPARNG